MARTMRTIITMIMGRMMRRNVLFFWGPAWPVGDGVELVTISLMCVPGEIVMRLPVRGRRGSSFEQRSRG
jgi:hypothetical protein